jgi:hypothetical protein
MLREIRFDHTFGALFNALTMPIVMIHDSGYGARTIWRRQCMKPRGIEKLREVMSRYELLAGYQDS